MTKIVLVGAGSLQFGTGILGDIFSSSVLDGAEIVLNDIDKKAADRMMHMAQDYINSNCLTHKIRVEANLLTALRGAKFVVISIEVGDRFKLWDMDWRIPQQYGIQQVYGENGGPGDVSVGDDPGRGGGEPKTTKRDRPTAPGVGPGDRRALAPRGRGTPGGSPGASEDPG